MDNVIRDRTNRMTKAEMVADIKKLVPHQDRDIHFSKIIAQNTLHYLVGNYAASDEGLYYNGNIIAKRKHDTTPNNIFLTSHRNKNKTVLKRLQLAINMFTDYNYDPQIFLHNNLWYIKSPESRGQVVFYDGMVLPVEVSQDIFQRHEYLQMKSLSFVESYCRAIKKKLKDGKVYKPDEARIEIAQDTAKINTIIENCSWSDTLLFMAEKSEGERNTRQSAYRYDPITILMMRLRRFLKRFYNLPVH